MDFAKMRSIWCLILTLRQPEMALKLIYSPPPFWLPLHIFGGNACPVHRTDHAFSHLLSQMSIYAPILDVGNFNFHGRCTFFFTRWQCLRDRFASHKEFPSPIWRRVKITSVHNTISCNQCKPCSVGSLEPARTGHINEFFFLQSVDEWDSQNSFAKFIPDFITSVKSTDLNSACANQSLQAMHRQSFYLM